MANKKTKKTGIGLAAWLLVAIVLLIIFLVKWETIHDNLVKSGLIQGELIATEKVEKKSEKTPEKKSDKAKNDNTITLKVQNDKSTPTEIPSPATTEKYSDKNTVTETPKRETKSDTEKSTAEKNIKATENETAKKSSEQPETKPAPKPVEKTNLNLCFIVIDADGTLNYKIVTRSVNKNDSPLTTAINLVLTGPSMTLATEKDCISLIPSGTKLLGASVSNGIATLNFSEAFEINPDGFEGYIAQLKQIIFTATQFDTVKSVQFLIEGKKHEYLGSDGVRIGTPLSRASF